MPQISVITPSLNQGEYLPDALVSVAEQSGVAAEHLVYDPGSWDGSRDTLRAWAEGAPNRRLFLERDAGVADALNKGVGAARADIVGWLCSDDLYASQQSLASVRAAFDAHPDCDIVYGRGAYIDERGRTQRAAPFQNDPSSLRHTLRAADPFLQPAAFVRRSLFERIGPFDPRFGLAFDIEFWLRAVQSGAKFFALDADLARKRLHVAAVTRLQPGVRAMDGARATRAHLGAAGSAWVARAIQADVAEGSAASALAAAAARRRLDREGGEDLLAVLGNGPSLANFDFEQLRGVDAIGMNAAYRHWQRIGWHPRYYACLDEIVGVSHRAEIEAMILDAEQLGVDAFLLRDNLIQLLAPAARRSARVISFDALAAPGGLLDISPITTGSHAALFAALLGYRKIVLLGIDCNYVEKIEEAEARKGYELELVGTPSHNPNYFFADYQRAGDRYSVPNPMPDLHLNSWRNVGARLGQRGVEVWNASRKSRLDAFPVRDFERVRSNVLEQARE